MVIAHAQINIMDLVWNLIYMSCMALFVAGVFWGTLRLMDHTLKVDFNDDVFPAIQKNPIALAVYAGCRLLALAFLYAPLLRVIL